MKSSGFTLVELVVVISIIALLLALSLPISQRIREQARATACAANISQLQLAFHIYETTYQSLPYGFAAMRTPAPPGGYLGNLSLDLPGWYWPNYIQAVQHNSLRDLRILECPAKRVTGYFMERDVLCGNYGVNRSLCRSANDLSKFKEAFGGLPRSTATVSSPTLALLLVDSGYALICWWQTRDDPLMTESSRVEYTAYVPGMSINKERTFMQGQYDDARDGRHPGKTVNVGFLDGHVERKRADELLVEKIGEDSYRNLDPLWEPK
jgi:prepilin-type processing-associated H-X9-DG protein/prepilin-type N-terminal cleavage/methylation domain-containing protein